MNINDYKIGNKYSRKDLMLSFKGAFQGGINICKATNTIVITSKHTGNRIYDDNLFNGDIMYYCGEGQKGDQRMIRGNKAILEARNSDIDIHLFVRFKPTEYTYFGIVDLVDSPFFDNKEDVEGNMRKVIMFPMMRRTLFRNLTSYEMRHITMGGVTPLAKQELNVVGAAIVNENGEVLCAQRGYGSLIGKWEFPGGKVENGETEKDALIREIKEELDITIKVDDFIEESSFEYSNIIVNLKVYKCSKIDGEINNVEHQSLKWVKPQDMEDLDWADADKPIVETYLDSLPASIDRTPISFDYFEAQAIKNNDKSLARAVQDYEKSQRNKQKSGENAELAVLTYERDKLNNLGHPELADLVKQVSKENSAAGYDIISYEINTDNSFKEIHIEVKSAKLSSQYIEFFISENELNKFKNDPQHRIYCLFKNGRKYKLHEVNKSNFFRNNYLSPMMYRVRIRIAV